MFLWFFFLSLLLFVSLSSIDRTNNFLRRITSSKNFIKKPKLKEVTVEENDGVKNTNCIANHPATPKSVKSCYDALIAPDTTEAFTPEDFTGDKLITFAKGTSNADPVASTTLVELGNIHKKRDNYSKDISSEVFSDAHSVRFLDSVSDEWNSDGCIGAGDDVDELSVKEDNIVTPPESHGYANCGLSSECVGADDNYSKRAKYSSRDCSSSISHSVLPDKTGKEGRQLSGNSGGICKFSSGGNVPVRMGKENNLSVCQKVRKNNGDERTRDSKAAPIGSQSNNSSKEAPLSKRVSNVVDADESMKANDDRNLKVRVSEKMKKNTSLGAKHDYNCYSRKGSRASKANSARVADMKMQEKEVSKISTQVNHHIGFSTGTKSHSYIDHPKAEKQTNAVDCSPEKVSTAEICLDERKAPESVCNAVSSVSSKAAPNKNSPSSRTSELLDQTHSLELQPRRDLHPVTDGSTKLEKEISNTKSGNQDHSSGSVLQMWMPVVKKDVSDETATGTQVTCLDESPVDGLAVENIDKEELGSNTHSFVPVTDAVAASAAPNFCDAKLPSPRERGQVEKSNYNSTCPTRENDNDHTVAYSVVTLEPIHQNISKKITEAVRDAYRIEMNSKVVELATGNPLAEFERFLYSASPVLHQTDHFQRYWSCPREDVIGASQCRHDVQDFSLASLWQWYEEHGSYGLEVRAEDYQNYKRMGIDRFSFRAYFVPFLSAVQLFGSSKSRSTNSSNKRPSVAPLNPLHTSGSSSVPVDYPELLFEYFESDQPHQRRPLFEKIKELVRGDGLTNDKGYGDPTKLESMDVHDLHPASWYSVAWYPIYRIPGGNFRASFLTYHSLGHLVHRGTSADCPGSGRSVVSPVVGLESYNTQAECWFQLRPSGVTHEEASSHKNRSELLKERLRTLEKTASVMARADVIKEKVKSTNRQPDYEFFHSRRQSYRLCCRLLHEGLHSSSDQARISTSWRQGEIATTPWSVEVQESSPTFQELAMKSSFTLCLVLLLTTFGQILVPAIANFDYGNALDKSLLFFQAQRSGNLQSGQRIKWRGDSGLKDGFLQGVNLVGGYYDAGDHVKFGLPMAFTVTMLSWAAVDFRKEITSANQLHDTLDAIKWGTDYFIKAHTKPNELWGQVGDGDSDHYCWQRAEDMTTPRTAYKLDANHPGSDLAGETAAALAAASLAFKPYNATYSKVLLAHAIQLFEFADEFRGRYDNSIPSARNFYASASGYSDELLWAAAWLHRATNQDYYLKYAVNNAVTLGGTGWAMGEFSWDNKYAGVQILMSKVLLEGRGGAYTSTLKQYQAKADYFTCSCLQKNDGYNVLRTPGGLLYIREWNNLQYVSSAAFLLAVYSDYLSAANNAVIKCPDAQVGAQDLLKFSQSQVDYILGKNPNSISYLVGYGSNYPVQVHHRGSSIASISTLRSPVGCVQGFEMWYYRKVPNPNVLYGALVGGPDKNDGFSDERYNYEATEPTISGTAPLVGVFSKLMSVNGGGYPALKYKKPAAPVPNYTGSTPYKNPSPLPHYKPSSVPVEFLHSITATWTVGQTKYYRHRVSMKNTSKKMITGLKLAVENLSGSLWGLVPTGQKNIYELPQWLNVLKPGTECSFVYVQGGPQVKVTIVSYQ